MQCLGSGDGLNPGAAGFAGRGEEGVEGLDARLLEGPIAQPAPGGQVHQLQQVEAQGALDADHIVGTGALEAEARVVEARHLHALRIRHAQGGEARLQCRLLEQGDLHRGILRQRPGEEGSDGGIDGAAVVVGALQGEFVGRQGQAQGRVGRGAQGRHAALGIKLGAGGKQRGTQPGGGAAKQGGGIHGNSGNVRQASRPKRRRACTSKERGSGRLDERLGVDAAQGGVQRAEAAEAGQGGAQGEGRAGQHADGGAAMAAGGLGGRAGAVVVVRREERV